MKKVTFLKAGARNFCVYQELIEFEFKNNKICMITGPNGTGKTTLIDILPFSLYGTTSKGLRSDDVVNNKVNKNCYAFSEFLVSASNLFFSFLVIARTLFLSSNVVFNFNKSAFFFSASFLLLSKIVFVSFVSFIFSLI